MHCTWRCAVQVGQTLWLAAWRKARPHLLTFTFACMRIPQGHGVSVDWWALGCVIYEMLYGFPPFYGNGNHQETYRRITGV